MDVTPRSSNPSTPDARRAGSDAGTILVCEDDKHLGLVIEIMLGEHGYRVLVAASPHEALKLAETHDGPIHLLITDVVLQWMRGPELAQQVRSMRPELEVLFISGYSAHDDEHLQLPEGAAFLQKPFRPGMLIEKTRGLMATAVGHVRGIRPR
jgi:two-component system, cell cycle sensor histidine kinase and response regulator CckA